MTVATDSLPDDAGTLKAMLIAERVQNERLRQIIKELQRHRFGRRAETLPEDQMLLGLEEVEQVAASGEAEPARRFPGSIAAGLFALAQGAAVLRVHDVRGTKQAIRVWHALSVTEPFSEDVGLPFRNAKD